MVYQFSHWEKLENNNFVMIATDHWKAYEFSFVNMAVKTSLGIGTDELKPIEHLKSAKGAVLIISGAEDKHTTVEETRKMFSMANEPKELLLVEGKGYVDFFEMLGKTV